MAVTGRALIGVEGSEETGLQPGRSERGLSSPLSSEEASTETGCLLQRGSREVTGALGPPCWG